jgi:hypothetical protein
MNEILGNDMTQNLLVFLGHAYEFFIWILGKASKTLNLCPFFFGLTGLWINGVVFQTEYTTACTKKTSVFGLTGWP